MVRILPDGLQEDTWQKQSGYFEDAATGATRYLEGTLPNGWLLHATASFLIANFGTDCLEVMLHNGESEVLGDSIDGQPTGKVNFHVVSPKALTLAGCAESVANWFGQEAHIRYRGTSGASWCRQETQPSPGIISRDHPIAVLGRPAGYSVTSPDIVP